jgi:hypothetical protein
LKNPKIIEETQLIKIKEIKNLLKKKKSEEFEIGVKRYEELINEEKEEFNEKFKKSIMKYYVEKNEIDKLQNYINEIRINNTNIYLNVFHHFTKSQEVNEMNIKDFLKNIIERFKDEKHELKLYETLVNYYFDKFEIQKVEIIVDFLESKFQFSPVIYMNLINFYINHGFFLIFIKFKNKVKNILT